MSDRYWESEEQAIQVLSAEVERLRAERNAALALLRRFEWSDYIADAHPRCTGWDIEVNECPICLGWRESQGGAGHASDCPLPAALEVGDAD
jgi:hypothetical protein